MKQSFIETLRWRGMVHDIMPGTEEYIKKECVTGYIGFDPTADSLHIGNLAQIMMLVHFQQCGHKPLILVGGATGMIGDPSGKSAERVLLSRETLEENIQAIQKQLKKFLRFDGNCAAEIVNNHDWFKNLLFLDFIRDVGKHITVNYMMAKESIQKRLDAGISFTEFSYQLVQGYDFYWLYEKKGCTLQMGGSDQWGNMVTGTELIRRKAHGKAYALTSPLVKKADGTKFGKTESKNIWLNCNKTSVYTFYQYWLNTSDEDAVRFIKVFTEKSEKHIHELNEEHKLAAHKRLLQKELAKDITIRVHSEKEYEMAVKASNILFGDALEKDLESLDKSTLLSLFEGVPRAEIAHSVWMDCPSVTDLLSGFTKGVIFSSKGEAKRMIKEGGVRINKNKIQSPDQKPSFKLLHNQYLIAQKGKKNYYLIEIV